MSVLSVVGVVTGGRFAVPTAFVEIVESPLAGGVSVLNYGGGERVALSLTAGGAAVVAGGDSLISGGFVLRVNGVALTLPVGSLEAAAALWAGGAGVSLTVYDGLQPATARAVELLSVPVGGGRFVLAAQAAGSGLTVHRVQGDGSLAQVSALGDGAGAYLGNVVSLAAAEVGGACYVIAGSSSEGGISVMRLTVAGVLEPVDSLGIAQMVPIPYVSAVDVARIGGESFVLVASAGASALAVFRLTGAGELEPVDYLIDSRDTRFAAVSQMDVFEVAGRVFVVVAGGDDGLSLFEMLPGGRLIHRQTFEDSMGLTLAAVSAIRAVVVGDVVQILVSSGGDAGVTVFELGTAGLGGVIAGTGRVVGSGLGDLIRVEGGATRVEAGLGDDLVMDGAGRDTIYGGGGADLFVFGADGEVDELRDFDPAVDRLDLSCWPMLRDLGQLLVRPTATGATISFGAEVLVITSALGRSLTVDEVLAAISPLSGGRYEVVPQTAAQPAPSVPVVAHGTDGADVLLGVGLADHLFGGAGDDSLQGGGGNDSLYGGLGADFLFGDEGDDLLNSGGGGDVLEGGNGNDSLTGSADGETLRGGAGDDSIEAMDGDNWAEGGAGRDVIRAGVGADRLWGGTEDDFLFAGAGNDLAYGGAGNDAINGGGGNDTLYGEDGADTLAGTAGDDLLYGGGANDQLGGGPGNDTLAGGDGDDILGAGLGHDLIWGGAGDDRAGGGKGRDTVHGDDGNDNLAGAWDNDELYGGAGRDSIGGGTGDDLIYGGIGDDLVGAGDGDDLVFGEAGFDFLGGGAGNDTLDGGGWADTLNGGGGDDSLIGGGGADVFVFNQFTAGEVDRIADFTLGEDRLRLKGIEGAGAQGRFDALVIYDGAIDGVAGTLIRYDGHVIFLEHVSAGALSVSDFWFT